MDYQEFVTAQFIPKVTQALNALKTALVSAGISAANVTVGEVTTEAVNDLRYQLTARRGNRNLRVYVELTAAGIIDGAMALVITIYVEGNGSQITLSYAPGNSLRYDLPEAIDSLLTKLSQCETAIQGELLTAARAFLQV